nr:hypothetical protein [Tanacetum cinerariifolium]
MGELRFFLGLQVKQKQDGIFISQDKYVAAILKKYVFTEVKNASTSMETQKPMLKNEDGEEVDVHIYQVNPKVSHLDVVKRIFRYLKCQPKFGLWYLKDSPFDLVAYTNNDYVGASLYKKSTTGGCQFLRCRLISWQCKKQTVVANSTTKAEYTKRKDTELPQTSGPTTNIADEAINEEMDDSLERAATTATSLDVEQDSDRVDSSADEASLGENASKQERIINDIYVDEGITLIDETAKNQGRRNDQEDAEMLFDVTNDLGGEEVVIAEQAKEFIVDKETINDITLAKALMEVKSAKPKADKDKGKGKMVKPEPVKKLSKKDQLMLDEELAFKLQAKKEEERLSREKAQQIEEVNIAWDDI